MFTSLIFKEDTKAEGELSYIARNPTSYFKENAVTLFKPGLNILYGGNGSGKSTLLNLLAFRLAALQGGQSVVTETWISNVSVRLFDDDGPLATSFAHIEHDGQPVMFFNPRQEIGRRGGHFDDDFFTQGMLNAVHRGSTGETTIQRGSTLFNLLMQEIDPAQFYPIGKDPISKVQQRIARRDAKRAEEAAKKKKSSSLTSRSDRPLNEWANRYAQRDKDDALLEAAQASLMLNIKAELPDKIDYHIDRKAINATWLKKLERAETFFQATIPVGQPTLLIDEPESGLSPENQFRLWDILSHSAVSKKYQLIVASHSAFALNIPHAHMIEMSAGYLAESEAAFRRKFGA